MQKKHPGLINNEDGFVLGGAILISAILILAGVLALWTSTTEVQVVRNEGVAVFQFVVVLITGKQNGNLTTFGDGLSRFVYQIAKFLTFNTEDKPFPFSEWPGATPAPR